jgi:tripartite ATP-independent transporter DctM subunit
MNTLAVGGIGFVIMLMLKGLRSPIGVGLGLVGFFGVWALKGFDTALYVVATAPVETLSRFTLAVFPLFILMGILAVKAGLADGLFNAANAMIGHRRGGLAIASIFGCGGFAAVNGSSLSTAATMAKLAVPQMLRFGYDKRLATGSVAAGGTLGIMIPPSLGMIVYAVLTESSIGKMFAAGIIPGIIAVGLYSAVISIWTRMDPSIAPVTKKDTWPVRLRAMRQVWGILLLFGVVMGGIFTGLFSPTEGGAVGAFGALVIGIAIGRINWPVFVAALRETVELTAMVMLIIVGVSIFEFFISSARFPQEMSAFINALNAPDALIIGMIILFLIILGGFMEVIAIIFITTPFLFPIIMDMGYDPIWWGIVMIMVGEFGVITPPVGMNVFVVAKMVPQANISDVFRGVLPFLIGDVVRLLLIIIFPAIALWLPNLLFP